MISLSSTLEEHSLLKTFVVALGFRSKEHPQYV